MWAFGASSSSFLAKRVKGVGVLLSGGSAVISGGFGSANCSPDSLVAGIRAHSSLKYLQNKGKFLKGEMEKE